MTLEELLQQQPTMSEDMSQKLFLEILLSHGWRTYGPGICEESEELARRFLTFHAKIPGYFSREIYGKYPAGIFYFESEKESIKGALFQNGAVIVAKENSSGKLKVSLAIDEATADSMQYPSEGYERLSQD